MGSKILHIVRSRPVRWALIALAYAAAFMLVNPGMWSKARFLGWDAVWEHWAAIGYGAEYLRTLSLPLWCPHERGGYPFLADPQTGALYPVNFIFHALVLVLGNGKWVIVAHLLTHVAIAAVGIHYAIQRMGMPAQAQWMGGLSYALSARWIKAKDTSWIWSAAWLPWIFIAADEHARRPTRRSGALLGLVCALSLTAGYTPNFFRNVVGVAPVFLVVVWATWRRDPGVTAYWRKLLSGLGIGLAVMVGLALPGILATVDLFPLSTRGELSMADVLYSPIHPYHVTNLVMPGMLKPMAFCYPYLGALAALLAALALAWRPSRDRILWACLAGVFFLLSCGENAFLLPALAQSVPLFKLWRIPTNYLFVANFFLSLLAARGLADLLAARSEQLGLLRRRALYITGAAGLVVLVGQAAALLAREQVNGNLVANAGTALFITAACGAVLLALSSTSARTRATAAWLALALLVTDIGLQLRPVAGILEGYHGTSSDRDLPRLKGIKREARLVDRAHFRYRVGMRGRVREFLGHANLLSLKRYWGYVNRVKTSYHLQVAANARYFAGQEIETIKQQAGEGAAEVLPGVLRFKEHAPFAFWTDRVRLLPDEGQVLDAMDRGEARDAALVAMVDAGGQVQAELRALGIKKEPPAGDSGWKVAATDLDLDQNSASLTIRAPRRGVVVINETFMPGWQARVNGKPAQLFQVNYMFRGLLVGPGKHRVEMVYRPGKVLAGLAVYALTVLALLAWGAVALARRRHRRRMTE